MLKQFIDVEGVGVFEELKLEGNTQLKESNIIYGENGCGKTTLCSILRSLRDDNPRIINQRKNINKDNQYIELLVNENKKCKFKQEEWCS